MKNQTRIRIGGAVIVLLGAISVIASLGYWAPCVGEQQALRPDGLIDNERLTAACSAAAHGASTGDLAFLMWPVAVILVLAVAAYSRRPWVSILAVIPLVALFPVIDPGFFWQPWDTADTVPGSGVLSSAAIVASGIVLWFSAAATRDPAPEDVHAGGRSRPEDMPRQADPDGLRDVRSDACRRTLEQDRKP